MAITAGHYYWKNGAIGILLCTDAATFGFLKLPDASVETAAADPTGVLTDLQSIGIVAATTTCTLDGLPYEVVDGYSTDGTAAHTKAALLRPNGATDELDKRASVVVPRADIPTASVNPPGALG